MHVCVYTHIHTPHRRTHMLVIIRCDHTGKRSKEAQ